MISVMNFPAKFIGWIKQSVTTTKFFANLNGSMVGYFSNERGLRQADPMPPYLYLLAT